MGEPGDRRPAGTDVPEPQGAVAEDRRGADQRTPPAGALALAILIAIGAALGWGLLRGILDLGVGLLAIAAVGGWGIGAALRRADASPVLAGAIGALAWISGLVITWVVSMAILQGSTRTFMERLEANPYIDWMAPQFGLFEIAALLVYVGAAVYGARRRAASSGAHG